MFRRHDDQHHPTDPKGRQTSRRQRGDAGHEAQPAGRLPGDADAREQFILEALHDLPNLPVFDSLVKHTVKLAETSLEGVPILNYASKSDAALAYRNLAGEVIARVEGREQ